MRVVAALLEKLELDRAVDRGGWRRGVEDRIELKVGCDGD
jgi:hypothetical protein